MGTYTKIITDMLGLNSMNLSMERAKEMTHVMGLARVYREFRTIQVRGTRQSGKTRTLVEWYINNPSILLTVNNEMAIHASYMTDGDTNGIRSVSSFINTDIDFTGIDFILLDEMSFMGEVNIGKMYHKVAKSGRHDIIFIAT